MKKIIKISILITFLTITILNTYNFSNITHAQDTNKYEGINNPIIHEKNITIELTEKINKKIYKNYNTRNVLIEFIKLSDKLSNKLLGLVGGVALAADTDKKAYGNYTMEDILLEAIEISNKLLGIVGSVALLFFIVAGIRMIFSGGSQEKIGSARQMMAQTIVGLVIFLSAYLIIFFIQDSLKIDQKYRITSGPPQLMSETTTEEETSSANCLCQIKKGNGAICRTFENTNERDEARNQGCAAVGESWCPDTSLTICCPASVNIGTPYSGNKTCTCTESEGTCEY